MIIIMENFNDYNTNNFSFDGLNSIARIVDITGSTYHVSNSCSAGQVLSIERESRAACDSLQFFS